MIEDEDLLMAVLNSAPVVDGRLTEQLEDSVGRDLVRRYGGSGTTTELSLLRETRDAIQDTIGDESAAVERLEAALDRATLIPEITVGGVEWHLDAPEEHRLAARVVLAWSQVIQKLPERLRACANTECNLYLIDHSRPGTAKWCSMSACGNRMKVRAHARRTRERP